MIVRVFDELDVVISDEDWKFLCLCRFFSDNPGQEDIEAEFVSDTGITPNKRHLWENASSVFAEYIKDLRNMNPYVYNPAGKSGNADELMKNEI